MDTGKGMVDAVRERILQPFFSTKGFEAGRGLGLSASYAIARAPLAAARQWSCVCR
jgi:C4-dicarboxylate-specific signal transduction histidine kinase